MAKSTSCIRLPRIEACITAGSATAMAVAVDTVHLVYTRPLTQKVSHQNLEVSVPPIVKISYFNLNFV
jgi:hypothetical protein